MGSTANVSSIEALTSFRAALLRFAEDAEAALVTLELEGRRPVDWVDDDRTRYWPQQARKASDAIAEARLGLERCELRVSGDDPRYCYEERKALEKAKRRLRLAEDKIQAVSRWRPQMHKEFEEFQVQIARFRRYLENDLPQAVAAMERMSASLERYLQVGGRGEGVSARGQDG
jgi:hypothetical protein